MKKGIILWAMCWLAGVVSGQRLLQSGPMLGYSEMREVLLWVQTTAPATVQFAYWEKDSANRVVFFTPVANTDATAAFTCKLVADKVLPGKTYEYQLYLNSLPVSLNYPTEFRSQPLWQWRTDPPEFTMALGSCAYINEPPFDRPGKPYGSEYEIFEAIYAKRPDMMLWLGDNTYLREADWFTQTGIFHRYTHSRAIPELQPLLASTHHYAIWDDHDYGTNDADRSFIHKEKSYNAFKAFWGNPTFGVPSVQGGITTQFQYHDVDFFLLDDRYHRSPNDRRHTDRTIMGKAQLEWLIDALASSRATFKVVAIGGMVLSSAKVYENYATYEAERKYLLEQLEREGIKGVIFLTGDRHHTELSKYTTKSGYTLYDFTCSPLTSGAATRAIEERNEHRVEGTVVMQHNFGTIRFWGGRKDRQMTLSVFDAQGQLLWERNIKATDFDQKN